MTLDDPLFIENAGAVYNAREYRRLFAALVGRRPGIFAVADFAVTEQSTPDLGVTVADGDAMVDATGSGIDGLYFVHNDADVDIALAAADPTNDRYDIIGIRIRDEESAGSDNDGALIAVTGTPAASPSDPALPDNFLPLARVTVDALASTIVNADITDLRRTDDHGGLVTAAGGIIPCTSATRPTTHRYVGLRIYELDTGRDLIFDGAGWDIVAPAIPHAETAFVTGGGSTTTSSSYSNLGVRCRIVGFVKHRLETDLVLDYAGGIANDNALGQYEVAIRVGAAGTDYAIASYFGTSPIGGHRAITGLAPGTYDLEVRYRRVNGVGTVSQVADAYTTLRATETL